VSPGFSGLVWRNALKQMRRLDIEPGGPKYACQREPRGLIPTTPGCLALDRRVYPAAAVIFRLLNETILEHIAPVRSSGKKSRQAAPWRRRHSTGVDGTTLPRTRLMVGRPLGEIGSILIRPRSRRPEPALRCTGNDFPSFSTCCQLSLSAR
jgi:hypothetical protein